MTLTFDEAAHRYSFNGKPVPGVTFMAVDRPVKTPPRGATAETLPVSATLVFPVSWRIRSEVRVMPSVANGPRSVTEEATEPPATLAI